MKNEKHYKSEAFASIHETMDALHQIKAIDKTTMRDFDKACLTSVGHISAQAVKDLRE